MESGKWCEQEEMQTGLPASSEGIKHDAGGLPRKMASIIQVVDMYKISALRR